MSALVAFSVFFFFNDTATTEIYTLSLHDALPISSAGARDARIREGSPSDPGGAQAKRTENAGKGIGRPRGCATDRKSTRLNSSHGYISYAVFCLKKKKTKTHTAAHDNNDDSEATH